MSGLIFNEDGNHFIHTRNLAGIKVGLEELNAFIDQYANTDIKEFMLNVNAMLAWFPAKSRENAIDKYSRMIQEKKTLGIGGIVVATSYDIFVRQGLDTYKIWLERLRYNNISPWISIRMNDIHSNDDEENFLHSSFYQKNKNMRRASHRTNSDYFDNALDYSFPEVREHNLSLIHEVSELYDFDGLEIDWMREAYLFRAGGEYDGIGILNDFMNQVRAILDNAEKTRGHKIKICVRVPQSPEIALRFGLDVLTWVKSGLVDIVVPTARWATTDNDMPIDFWKRLLAGTGVMLAAGLEILLEATRAQPQYFQVNSIETARGSAVSYLGMGAERIYLYNYMDFPVLDPSYPFMAEHAANPQRYHELLTTISSLEIAKKLPRRHVVTYHDIVAPGFKIADALPFHCNPPAFEETRIFTGIRIATGPVDDHSVITLIIGINCEKVLQYSDVLVFINSVACELTGIVELPLPRPVCKTYTFNVSNSGQFPEASIVEVATAEIPFTVEWVELSIN